MKKTKIMAFDMDGTLTPSRLSINSYNLKLLKKISKDYHIAILTGGNLDLIKRQVLNFIDFDCELHIFPTSGSEYFRFTKEGKINTYKRMYAYKMSEVDNKRINALLSFLIKQEKLVADTDETDMVEDRESQITFSAIGRNALSKKKNAYDPDRKKREYLVEQLRKLDEKKFNGEIFKNYNVLIGGTTSIDFVNKHHSKGKSLINLSEMLNIDLSNIFYFGDKVVEGGNDYSVVEVGKIIVTEVKDDKDLYLKLSKMVV